MYALLSKASSWVGVGGTLCNPSTLEERNKDLKFKVNLSHREAPLQHADALRNRLTLEPHNQVRGTDSSQVCQHVAIRERNSRTLAIKFQPLAIKHKSNGLVWVGAQEGNALPNPPKITSGRLSPMYLNVRLSARLPQTLSIKLELLQTNLILFQKKINQHIYQEKKGSLKRVGARK